MPRRLRSLIASVIGIVLALVIFFAGQHLDRAAAWANIFALFVGIAGLAVGVMSLFGSPSGGNPNSPVGGTGARATKIKQSGRARGDVINVAGDGNRITTNRRP